MRNVRWSLFAVVCAVAVFAIVGDSLTAGALGAVEGLVVDGAGVAVQGVLVTLAQKDMPSRTTTTGADGTYRFVALAPGRYTVTATLAGFRAARRFVDVRADATARIDLALSVAAMTEEVSVAADEPRVARERKGENRKAAQGIAVGAYAPPVTVPRSDMFGFNTEDYRHIADNRFIDVEDDPLATFAVDVDTASYANVRRFLQEGALPPADAVRIEEMVNAFAYDYPEPPPQGPPFSITTELGACPWNAAHRLALVGLQGRRIPFAQLPPLNLVFLVDVSGSMDTPDKLPYVATALGMLAESLRPQDRVAIVVYAGSSGLVLPSTPGTRKDAIKTALARLKAGGSTNGAGGIVQAYDVAAEHHGPGVVSRVVLATDGDFNVGVTSHGELVRLIEKKRESGVFLSVLGVGTGNLKDGTMEAIADHGNGVYAYLDSLDEARHVLVENASATLVTIAKDVKVQVEFNPRTVARYRLVGYENRLLRHQDFRDDKKDAGDIGAGHSVTALFEIEPRQGETGPAGTPLRYQRERTPSAAAREGEVLKVALRYKQPDEGTSRPLEAILRNGTGAGSDILRFSSAVAAFGMLLRDSPDKGAATYRGVAALARESRGPDRDGRRAELVRLVELAEALTATRVGAR